MNVSNYCYSIYHNVLNVINCSMFLFIFRHGPLTIQRNSRETWNCFEVLPESFCKGRYSEMSSEARHFCVAARVIPRNDFCSGAATDACPSKSMHPWSHHNPRAYNLPMGCIKKENTDSENARLWRNHTAADWLGVYLMWVASVGYKFRSRSLGSLHETEHSQGKSSLSKVTRNLEIS